MGKKGSKKQWVDYYISMHLGFCHGPVDSVEEILMKEKPVLDEPMGGNGHVDVNKPEIFGGNEREGGAVGRIYYLSGILNQLIPEEFAKRLKLTAQTAPGFRGICSLLFVGNEATGTAGFNISSNYPSVPSIWARFRRASTTLNTSNAVIVSRDEKRHNSNPSHMIHECLVNKKWGMGGPRNQLDTASFNAAAATLFNEKFGMSMQWTRSSTIEAFIQEVINHIKGLFFFNPRTGLGQLRLLRNDYDPDNLDVLGPSNAELISFRRKLWGETVNEIVVSWTNPATEEEETVTYQDLGNISMQGEVVSEGRNYYGIREAQLAAEIASRDIVEVSAPLATAKVRVDRRQWAKLPGDVIKLTWPPRDIETVIMRIMDIDYGRPSDSVITLSLVEDVYGLARAEFINPPTTEWEDPDQDPDGGAGKPNMQLPVKFVAIPYPMISRALGEAATDDRYPAIVIGALATPTPEQHDVHSFYLMGEGTLANGNPVWVSSGEKRTTGMMTLGQILPAEASSILLVGNVQGGLGAQLSGLALIGNDDLDDDKMELVMFDQNLGNGAWRIARGMIDTVPRQWSGGAKVWFIGSNFNAYDGRERTAFTPWDYKLRPRTSLGIMKLENAVVRTTTLVDRPYLPFRPANVKVGLTAFGKEDLSENYDPRSWLVNITWSNRNRKTEDSIFRRWTEATTAPEPGQTTTIILTYADGGADKEKRFEGLTGTSFSFPVEDTGRVRSFKIKVIAERNGLESLQGHEIDLELYKKGYGSDWGKFFGGWPEQVEL